VAQPTASNAPLRLVPVLVHTMSMCGTCQRRARPCPALFPARLHLPSATHVRIFLVRMQALAMHYDDVRAVHGVFGSACYIDDSFPVVLYLAAKVLVCVCVCVHVCVPMHGQRGGGGAGGRSVGGWGGLYSRSVLLASSQDAAAPGSLAVSHAHDFVCLG